MKGMKSIIAVALGAIALSLLVVETVDAKKIRLVRPSYRSSMKAPRVPAVRKASSQQYHHGSEDAGSIVGGVVGAAAGGIAYDALSSNGSEERQEEQIQASPKRDCGCAKGN